MATIRREAGLAVKVLFLYGLQSIRLVTVS
jgi:hypothetical protein